MRIWKMAAELAARTPPQRNRYVDFLRAASICVVIIGHWLMTTVYYDADGLTTQHVFKVIPVTQGLTWIFQVMPIFFIVGGYANAVSLESARRKGVDYGGWLVTRLYRLIIPLLLLVLSWSLFALALRHFDVGAAAIQLITRAALIPTWFLAIYIMVVILAPAAYWLWRRIGWWSFWLLVALAVLMDTLFFGAGIRWPSWSSYFWVWLAIHNLGFAWRDGRCGGTGRLLLIAALALGCLFALVLLGPYPLPMVGSPDMTLSNTTPPKVTLIALGLLQFGLLLALQGPMRRLLEKPPLWTVTVLINSMIMSVYLWHITVMAGVIALLYVAGGFGLDLMPGSADWWMTRPFWIGGLLVLLVPLALLLSPLERVSRDPTAPVPSPLRQVAGAAMICLGIALLALFGYGGSPLPWLDYAYFALIFAGAAICGLLAPIRRSRPAT